MTLEIERTPTGAVVRMDGAVRATFVGDLADPGEVEALRQLVAELFGDDADAAIEFFLNTDLT